MIELSDNMLQFVNEVFPAIVGTRRRDGTVQMNPIWFEYKEGYFWLNGWRGADWLRHVERDGDVTLALIDPNNMYRFAQVQGRLVEVTQEGGEEHIDHLSLRYNGKLYEWHSPERPRLKVQVEPVRITGSIDWQPR